MENTRTPQAIDKDQRQAHTSYTNNISSINEQSKAMSIAEHART